MPFGVVGVTLGDGVEVGVTLGDGVEVGVALGVGVEVGIAVPFGVVGVAFGVGEVVGVAGTLGDGEADVEGVVSAIVMVVDSPAVSAGDDCTVHRAQANASRVKARFMAEIQWPSCK